MQRQWLTDARIEDVSRAWLAIRHDACELEEHLSLFAETPQPRDAEFLEREQLTVDHIALLLRQAEAQLLPVIEQLDHVTAGLHARLFAPSGRGGRRGTPLRLHTRIFLRSKRGELSSGDSQSVAELDHLLQETEHVLKTVADHRHFLKDLLARCEPSLERSLTKIAEDTETDGTLRRSLLHRQDIYQNFIELVIESLSGIQLIYRKLWLDAQNRVLMRRGLPGAKDAASAGTATALPEMVTKASAGLLSLQSIGRRKTHIDMVYRMRFGSSRQAGT